jgi:O-antigen ligase
MLRVRLFGGLEVEAGVEGWGCRRDGRPASCWHGSLPFRARMGGLRLPSASSRSERAPPRLPPPILALTPGGYTTLLVGVATATAFASIAAARGAWSERRFTKRSIVNDVEPALV